MFTTQVFFPSTGETLILRPQPKSCDQNPVQRPKHKFSGGNAKGTENDSSHPPPPPKKRTVKTETENENISVTAKTAAFFTTCVNYLYFITESIVCQSIYLGKEFC